MAHGTYLDKVGYKNCIFTVTKITQIKYTMKKNTIFVF